MIKSGEIQKIAGLLKLRDTQIEKDYILGWVLKGISNNDFLINALIFKGGTALRKIYFPDYRLSEDLDFTFKGENFNIDEINNQFEKLIEWVKKESRITLKFQDPVINQTGNYTFYLGYTGPLGGAGANKSIKVDIANDEILCNDPLESNVNNEYSDLSEEFKVITYTLDEIISEKMRSLMQRTMPRDLFDLYYLFENQNYNIEDYIFDFRKKAEYKKMDPDTFIETVQNKKEKFKGQWESNLVNQIQKLPDFEDVWRRLSKHWKKYDKMK